MVTHRGFLSASECNPMGAASPKGRDRRASRPIFGSAYLRGSPECVDVVGVTDACGLSMSAAAGAVAPGGVFYRAKGGSSWGIVYVAP